MSVYGISNLLYNHLMKNQRHRLSLYIFIACAGAAFLFFLMISRWAPVAGDDWGYAVGGRYNNPFVKALGNYFSWSGRFLSELWGFMVAPHKHLWNVLNAAIFTGIFVLISWGFTKKNRYLTAALTGLLILAVPNGLRMQTYTWIMGTTYVIPMLLFLVHALLLRRYVFEDNMGPAVFALLCVLNLAIPLYMENAAAMLFGANVLVLLYVFLKDKSKLKKTAVLAVISLIGVILIRFSPGALFRMGRDHAEFNSLSLFGKIAVNWLPFIKYTFTNNENIMKILSAVFITLVLQKEDNKLLKAGMCLVLLWGIVQPFSWQLFSLTGINLFYIIFELTVPHSLTLNTVCWGLWTAVLFLAAYRCMERSTGMFVIWLLFCAGGANMVMLISPIFDVRSSFYTVFLFILIVSVGVSELRFGSVPAVVFAGAVLVLCGIEVLQYYKLYRLIHQVDIKRMSQIAYYQERPDAGEAYILGYPAQTVHSADITEDDTYHMQYFKEYYYLDPDMHLNFYYLKDYTEEEIRKG